MEQPRRFSGTGLGLSICARQVRALLQHLAFDAADIMAFVWCTLPVETCHQLPDMITKRI